MGPGSQDSPFADQRFPSRTGRTRPRHPKNATCSTAIRDNCRCTTTSRCTGRGLFDQFHELDRIPALDLRPDTVGHCRQKARIRPFPGPNFQDRGSGFVQRVFAGAGALISIGSKLRIEINEAAQSPAKVRGKAVPELQRLEKIDSIVTYPIHNLLCKNKINTANTWSIMQIGLPAFVRVGAIAAGLTLGLLACAIFRRRRPRNLPKPPRAPGRGRMAPV